MAELDQVRRWADALITLHLDASWSFGFDHAKTRAGLCNFTARRISVSRHLMARFDDDEAHQVLLHEVAHALAGPRAGHGPTWRRMAADLGYAGSRTHDGGTATEFAPWVGRCAAGHDHYRYRSPTKPVSCGKCARRFDPAHVIRWEKRVPPHRRTA